MGNRHNPIQTNFTAGEVSPRIKGRVDIARYNNGVQKLKNFIIIPQGGVYRRSGNKYAAEVKTSASSTRLVEFEFSTTQAYVIEFGDQYLRFFKDEGVIALAAQNITGITKANPAVVTYAGADTYANGDRVLIAGVAGMVELNNREFTVANVNAGANTFELSGINSTGYTTYTSGGTISEIYEITTPYLAADLFELQFTQSADTLYITHPDYAPRKLTRTGHTSWTLSTIDLLDGPYISENTTSTTMTPSATSGNGITITASASTFTANDVGRLIRIKHSSTWGYAKIVGFTGVTQVTADVKSNFGATTAVTTWRLGSFYTANYPQCVVFHEDRLTFANTPSQPQTFWMSKSADYENFAPTATDGTVADDSAITATLSSNTVNAIRWLDSGPVLSLGTAGSEWQVKAGSINEPITPTNIQATQQTKYGSRLLRSRRVGSAILYIQRSGRKVREYQYNFQIDGFVSKELSLLSEHLLREGDYITDIAFQQEPDSVMWMVRKDGVLVGMTYLPEQEVVGFFQVVPGGSFDSGNAVVESIAVIPNPEGTADQLWMIVKRTINGATKRYVEFLEEPFNPSSSTDKTNMFFLDSGLTYSGGAATTISGLFHLEGQTVGVCADGAVHPDRTVTNGSITLQSSATLCHVGLKYDSTIKTLPVEGGGEAGTSQGKSKRVHRIGIRLLNSLGLSYGPDEEHLIALPFRSTNDDLGSSPPLFTGDKDVLPELPIESEGVYVIKQTNPYPLTILALMPEVVVYR